MAHTTILTPIIACFMFFCFSEGILLKADSLVAKYNLDKKNWLKYVVCGQPGYTWTHPAGVLKNILTLQEKLCDVIDILIPDPLEEKLQSPIWAPEREVTMESAVTGALENAFWQMVSSQ